MVSEEQGVFLDNHEAISSGVAFFYAIRRLSLRGGPPFALPERIDMTKWSSAALVIETQNSTYVLTISLWSHELYCYKGTYKGKSWKLASLAPYMDGWNEAADDRMATANSEAMRLEGKPHVFHLYRSRKTPRSKPDRLTLTTVKRAYWTLHPPMFA